ENLALFYLERDIGDSGEFPIGLHQVLYANHVNNTKRYSLVCQEPPQGRGYTKTVERTILSRDLSPPRRLYLQLNRQARRTSRDSDPDSVHDLRVSIRRLQQAISAYPDWTRPASAKPFRR